MLYQCFLLSLQKADQTRILKYTDNNLERKKELLRSGGSKKASKRKSESLATNSSRVKILASLFFRIPIRRWIFISLGFSSKINHLPKSSQRVHQMESQVSMIHVSVLGRISYIFENLWFSVSFVFSQIRRRVSRWVICFQVV